MACSRTVGGPTPAQILSLVYFYNSLLVYNSFTAAIYLNMIWAPDNSIYMSNWCCFVQSSKIFLYIYCFRSFFNTPVKSLTCGTWHFLKFQQSVGKKDTKKCSSYIFHPLLNCFFLVEDKKNHRMISHFYSRIWYLYICECFICFLALKK